MLNQRRFVMVRLVIFVNQLENVLIFNANVALNRCDKGTESYDEFNCKRSITTAAAVGSGQI